VSIYDQGVQPKFGKKCGNVGRALEMWDFLKKCRNFRKNVEKVVFSVARSLRSQKVFLKRNNQTFGTGKK
jgi:hypothetical protein